MTTVAVSERTLLRGLAKQLSEIAAQPEQERRRDLWRRHNRLIKTKPPVFCRPVSAWRELVPSESLLCRDELCRSMEFGLRQWLYWATLPHDLPVEARIQISADHDGLDTSSVWGLTIRTIPSGAVGGAWKFDPPMKSPDDLQKLVKPRHQPNLAKTAERLARAKDLVGDLLTIDVAYHHMGLAPALGNVATYLRGLEQMMLDLVERPEWFHRLMTFLSEAWLQYDLAVERAGHIVDNTHWGQFYSSELPLPDHDPSHVRLKDTWCFTEAQEFAQVSPAMHEEFLLRYQLPLIERFGLCEYGCCEDLTHKYDMLIRNIKSLRRVGVTPWAKLEVAREKLGLRYVLSWRPNPADISYKWDPEQARRQIREGMQIAGDCIIEVYMKDIETVQNDPQRLVDWCRIAQEEVEAYG